MRGHEDLVVEVGGAHLNLRGEVNMRREIERYDIPVYAHSDGVADMRFVVGGELRRGLPVPAGELSAVERAVIRMATDARRLNPAVPLADQAVDDLDISIADYFRQLDLPSQTYDFVVGVLAGWIQADPERTTVLHLLQAVLSCGGSPFNTFFGTFGEGFVNGVTDLVTALAGPDLDVRLGATVTRISHDQNGVTLETATGDIHTARACVVAVPAWTLGNIAFEPTLGADKQEVLAHEHHIKGVKRVFLVEGAPAGFFGVGGMTSRVQWLFEDRVLDDGRALLVGFSLYEDLADNDLGVAQAAVEEYIPGVRVLAVDGEDPTSIREPRHRRALVSARPGPTGPPRRRAAEQGAATAFAGAELTTAATFWGCMKGGGGHRRSGSRDVANAIGTAATSSPFRRVHGRRTASSSGHGAGLGRSHTVHSGWLCTSSWRRQRSHRGQGRAATEVSSLAVKRPERTAQLDADAALGNRRV